MIIFSRPGIDSFKSFFELLWNKSLVDAPLTQDEVRSYVDTVLSEIHGYKGLKQNKNERDTSVSSK